MDPFKVLGLAESSIRKPSDLEKVRAKTKVLFKRYKEEKNKFELKKCLEAFEIIKRKVNKTNIGDENAKILGRGRKERELDKHFNHQSKEIKGNKDLRRELKKRKTSAHAQYTLPGENKERISRRRMLRRDRKRVKKEKMKKRKKISVDIIEGLRRITGHMLKKDKFYKCMEMLYRWCKEYMNRENRQYVFIALSNAIESGHLTHDNDCRNIVQSIFQYVFGYYDYWFNEDCKARKDRKALQRCWTTASILRCHCYTDDAFMLTDVIQKLTDMMKSIEETSLSGLNDDDDDTEETTAPKADDASPNFSDAEEEESIRQSLLDSRQNEGEDDDDDDMAAMFGGFAAEDEPELSPQPKASPERKDIPSKGDAKSEKVNGDKIKKDVPVKQEEKASKKAKKEEVKKEKAEKKVIKAEIIDSDDEIEIKSESDGEQVKQEEDLISCSSDGDCSTLSSDESSDGGVQFVKMDDREETIFRTPSSVVSFNKLRHHFTECLGTLMTIRWNLWARSKIDTFFQEVYYKKDFFSEDQATKIEAWQAKIKAGNTKDQVVGEANVPLESKNPVVDARTEISIAGSGNAVWANKQFGLA